jgi:hypothetical protein
MNINQPSTSPSTPLSLAEDVLEFDFTIFQFENLEFRNFETSSFLPILESNCSNNTAEIHKFSPEGNFMDQHINSKMEGDCKDQHTKLASHDVAMDINQLFASLSEPMSIQTNQIQEKNSTDFNQVVQAHTTFKQEVRDELDELRYLISRQSQITLPDTAPSVVPATSANVSHQVHTSALSPVPVTSSIVSGVTSTVMTGQDFQVQMMQLLTESLSELSSALADKSTESKSDWPKFGGDSKKFRAWYMAIMAQLSLPPWQELYNTSTNDIVNIASNSLWNGKLYSKLLLSLEGQPLQDVITRYHLWANGILLLQELS